MDDVQNIRSGPGGGMDPEMMTPQQLHDTLWKVLSFRDNVSKKIENTLEKIPGLVSSAVNSFDWIAILTFSGSSFRRVRWWRKSPAISAFSCSLLWSLVSDTKVVNPGASLILPLHLDMKPIIKSATTGLAQGSAEVISSHDQLEVFHDPSASDPTHSFLSKDHFVSARVSQAR